MKNEMDKIIAKAWLQGCDPIEMLEKEGISLPENFRIPLEPKFKLGEEISRDTMNKSNTHMDSAYCYCG